MLTVIEIHTSIHNLFLFNGWIAFYSTDISKYIYLLVYIYTSVFEFDSSLGLWTFLYKSLYLRVEWLPHMVYAVLKSGNVCPQNLSSFPKFFWTIRSFEYPHEYVLISILISSLNHGFSKNVPFNFHIFEFFPEIFLLLIYNIIPLCSENILCMT